MWSSWSRSCARRSAPLSHSLCSLHPSAPPPRPLRAPRRPPPAPPAQPSAVPSPQPHPLCLRAQHVFPLSMLRLHEHEWHQMVDDAWVGLSKQHGEGIAMDADN